MTRNAPVDHTDPATAIMLALGLLAIIGPPLAILAVILA